MRLISFQAADSLHIGAVTNAGVVDFSLLDPHAPKDLGNAVKCGQLDDLEKLLAEAGDETHHQIYSQVHQNQNLEGIHLVP